ncbi:unnamed protein product [Caenorhabditis auriculariae]|uniref:Fibronectin type-III domain-containing protein n=1 Tax=Caenorhabditis auriculariae TaxID=2777116 RepID=A0A8S1H7C7_9PELO|nr:unnamed protein product [Caenorhabditis auriculariae]
MANVLMRPSSASAAAFRTFRRRRVYLFEEQQQRLEQVAARRKKQKRLRLWGHPLPVHRIDSFVGVLIFLLTVTAYDGHPLGLSTPLQENTEFAIDVDVKQRRLQLIVTDPKSPFFLYVTPCGAPVHWQLFEPIPGLSIEEEFEALRLERGPLDESEKFRLVAGEIDSQRMTFFSHHLSKRAILVLSATSSATARVFFSPSLLRVEEQYPPLPRDTRLAYSLLGPSSDGQDSRAIITWKISPTVRNAEAGRYRTCAILSRRPPAWAACEHVDEGVEAIKCVPQTNNSVFISSLRHGKPYFITVFVRDNLRGSSSPYEVLRIETDAPVQPAVRFSRKQKPKLLLNSKLESGKLDAKKGALLNYRFALAPVNHSLPTTRTALVVVHVCDGFVRMNVFRNGRLLKQSEPFSGFRRIAITNVRNGHLRFQIVNQDQKPKTVRIWASTQSSDSPYPSLPDDTSVKASSRTCSSATLQWLRAADPHVRYCVYKRRESANFLEQLVSKAGNLCEGGIASSELVGCFSHSSSPSSASLIETTVSHLKSSSTYRFDLLATPLQRPSAQALPYRTIWSLCHDLSMILIRDLTSFIDLVTLHTRDSPLINGFSLRKLYI